jgi:dihydropteroate synthase
VKLFGVVNASPDSLNEDSIVRTAADAIRRSAQLIADGVFGFDLGGQGSTFQAAELGVDEEWSNLEPIIPILIATGLPFSVDTWRPAVARRALEAGATWMNAADGLQEPGMFEVAADIGCPVVLPFLSGPDPLHMERVTASDPVDVLIDFFTEMLGRADKYGVRANMVLDPGTGFAPHDWPWAQRFEYQKLVYTQLDRLRIFGLPLYIALPWKQTAQHDELLEIVIRAEPEYGRVHYPAKVNAMRAERVARAAESGKNS